MIGKVFNSSISISVPSQWDLQHFITVIHEFQGEKPAIQAPAYVFTKPHHAVPEFVNVKGAQESIPRLLKLLQI